MGKKNKNRNINAFDDSDDNNMNPIEVVKLDDNDEWFVTKKKNNKHKNLFNLLGNTNSDSDKEDVEKPVEKPVENPVEKSNFTIAYEYDEACDYDNALEYYQMCENDKVAYNNIGVILWNKDKLNEALEYFEKAINLKYRKAMFNYALLVSDNLKIYPPKTAQFDKAKSYMLKYTLLKNADVDEKQIIFNLF
jgi:tetratricopeptide (TPR) repeat protein